MFSLRIAKIAAKSSDRGKNIVFGSVAYGHSSLNAKFAFLRLLYLLSIFFTAQAHYFFAFLGLSIATALFFGFLSFGICGTFGLSFIGITILGLSFLVSAVSAIKSTNLAHAGITSRSASIFGSMVFWEQCQILDNVTSGAWFHNVSSLM